MGRFGLFELFLFVYHILIIFATILVKHFFWQVDKLKELIRGRSQQQQGQGTPSRAAPPPPGGLWKSLEFRVRLWKSIPPLYISVMSDFGKTMCGYAQVPRNMRDNNKATPGGAQQRAANYSWGGRAPGYEQLPYPAQPQYNMPMPMPPSYNRWDKAPSLSFSFLCTRICKKRIK